MVAHLESAVSASGKHHSSPGCKLLGRTRDFRRLLHEYSPLCEGRGTGCLSLSDWDAGKRTRRAFSGCGRVVRWRFSVADEEEDGLGRSEGEVKGKPGRGREGGKEEEEPRGEAGAGVGFWSGPGAGLAKMRKFASDVR